MWIWDDINEMFIMPTARIISRCVGKNADNMENTAVMIRALIAAGF